MLELPRSPLVCSYYLTLRCNDTCEFCRLWQDEKFREGEEAPAEAIQGNLKDLRKLGVRYIDFTGGEPLLRQDLPEILKSAQELGLITFLTTNGILYRSQAEKLAGLIDVLSFSLDAPTREEHDRIRGADCFYRVIEGIKIAQNLKQNPIINFTLTRESIQTLPEMVELAEELKVLLWINPVFDYGELEGFEPESLAYIQRYFKHKLVGVNLAGLKLLRSGGNRKRGPVCRAVEAVITIRPDDCLAFPCFYHPVKKVEIKGELKRKYLLNKLEFSRREGRFDFCEGCLIWSYMLPSFYYKLNRYFFLNVYSAANFLWKRHRLREGKL